MKDLPKVFLSEPIHSKGIDMLKGKVNLIYAPDTRQVTTLALIADADAAILRATTTFNKAVIEKGINLKIIARTGVGLDNVDLKFAGEKGIFVCNTPGTNDDTVAEHTLAMILALAKQVITMDQAVRQQNWKERFSPKQMDIKGKKIGLIGLGKIGEATARLCNFMGMKVSAYDPFVQTPVVNVRIIEDMETIFRESDFVSLHCPSTPSTYKIVSAKYLQLMKKSAYLINTSRGDLIDEDALISFLTAHKIAGAALDVFGEEPLSATHPFLGLSNVILSPHVAGSTKESNERIAIAAAQAVLDTLEGKTPLNICNSKYFNEVHHHKIDL